jgi:hypothetical protein
MHGAYLALPAGLWVHVEDLDAFDGHELARRNVARLVQLAKERKKKKNKKEDRRKQVQYVKR